LIQAEAMVLHRIIDLHVQGCIQSLIEAPESHVCHV